MMNILSGKWAFDSHLFVYSQDEKSKYYKPARELFSKVLIGEIQAVMAQQNIVETERVLIQVYKRKSEDVVKFLEKIIAEFSIQIVTPLPTTYVRFHHFLKDFGGRVDFFDYYLAATMLDNNISQILTANDKDFTKIPGIKAVNPF